MTETKTETKTGPADEWGTLEVVDPETAKKALNIPESILKLADLVISAQSRDVITDGWSAEKLKEFQKLMRGAAEQKGTRFRMMALSNGGRAALRVTVMKANPNHPISAPPATETENKTEETPATPAPAKGKSK